MKRCSLNTVDDNFVEVLPAGKLVWEDAPFPDPSMLMAAGVPKLQLAADASGFLWAVSGGTTAYRLNPRAAGTAGAAPEGPAEWSLVGRVGAELPHGCIARLSAAPPGSSSAVVLEMRDGGEWHGLAIASQKAAGGLVTAPIAAREPALEAEGGGGGGGGWVVVLAFLVMRRIIPQGVQRHWP